MKNKKRLACQVEQFVAYAEIEVDVEFEHIGDGLEIIRGLENVDLEWHFGVMLALKLLREKLPCSVRKDIGRVSIISFGGQPVDTTTLAVAFVTFHAIAELVAPEIGNDFFFDEKSLRFILK